jgi:transcriptional regulator with XRE-family HTH domain
VTGAQFKKFRKEKGWTQGETAKKLNVSQGYLSLLEKDERRLTDNLIKKAVRVFGLRAGKLPVDKDLTKLPATNEEKLASELAAIGYPGFSHIKPTRLKNPTEVLLSALKSDKLDARIVEALPWLMLQISELNWKKLVRAAKVTDLQNRLGFVVSLARKTAERMGEEKKAESLKRKEKSLADSRLLKEDTLCSDSLTRAEVKWIRQNRTSEAEFWNVLSDLKVEYLSYAGSSDS